MKKFFQILGAVCITQSVNILAVPVSAQQTSSFNSRNLPICYFQTKTGEIVDLSDTCGYIAPSACTESLGSASRDAVLAEFCKHNNRCLLTNTCGEMPRGINAPPPGTPMGKDHLKSVSIVSV